MHRLSQLLLAALVAAVPVAASAGTIQKVTVDPAPSVPQQVVTVRVDGKKSCAEIVVDFGDDTAINLTDVDLKNGVETPKKYDDEGTYTITASPGPGGCKGSASATHKVASVQFLGNAALSCAILDNCPGPQHKGAAELQSKLKAEPQITGTLYPTVIPGGVNVLMGSGFGSAAGNLVLKLQNTAGVETFHALDVLEWHDDFIGFRVRDTIVNHLAQSGSVVVKNALSDKAGQAWLAFEPKLEVRMLAGDDVSLLFCEWPQEPGNSCCNAPGSNVTCPSSADPGWSPRSFWGRHEVPWGAIHPPLVDHKYATASLKNGWVIDSVDLKSWRSDSDPAEVTAPKLFQSPLGQAGGTIWLTFKVTQNDWAKYAVRVWAVGPAGTPHK